MTKNVHVLLGIFSLARGWRLTLGLIRYLIRHLVAFSLVGQSLQHFSPSAL